MNSPNDFVENVLNIVNWVGMSIAIVGAAVLGYVTANLIAGVIEALVG